MPGVFATIYRIRNLMNLIKRFFAFLLISISASISTAQEYDGTGFPLSSLLQDSKFNEASVLVEKNPKPILSYLTNTFGYADNLNFGWSRPIESSNKSFLIVALDISQRFYFDTFYTFSVNKDQISTSRLYIYGANIENPNKSLIDLDGDNKPEIIAKIDRARSMESFKVKIYKEFDGVWADKTSELISACISAGLCESP